MRSETGKAYLRGITGSYTMIFFSRSLAFGLILLAVSFFDLYAGIAGLISVLIANLAAAALGLNREKIASGMYGFNALLIGLGLGIAIQPSVSFYVLHLHAYPLVRYTNQADCFQAPATIATNLHCYISG